jgi:hypothetical protein
MLGDISFQMISNKKQQGLRFETPRAWIMKETSGIDGGKRDLVHGIERIDLNCPFKSTVNIVRSKVVIHCGAKTC